MSRTFANRSRPAQVQRAPRQKQMARSNDDDALHQQMNADGEETSSPNRGTRQARQESGYSVIPPNERNRQQIQRVAAEETRRHEEHREANRPTYNIVERLGGDGPSSNGEASIGQRNLPMNAARQQTPQEKARMYREMTKKEEDKKLDKMKQEQRQKSQENDLREKQRQEQLDEDRKIKRERFLASLEARQQTNQTLQNPSSSRPSDQAASVSQSGASTSAQQQQRHLPSASAGAAAATAAAFADEEEDMPAADLYDQREMALNQLECRFPYVDREVLETLLEQTGNDIERVAALLS